MKGQLQSYILHLPMELLTCKMIKLLYCIVLYYIVMYCIVLYCIALYYIVLYCIVLFFLFQVLLLQIQSFVLRKVEIKMYGSPYC